MTPEEFKDWFAYYKSRFTGVEAHLDKATSIKDAPTRKEILSGWFKVLARTDYKAAKIAVDRMHSGDYPEPKYFDKHPAAIRQIALKNTPPQYSAPKVIDGEYVYGCLECEDDGRMVVWEKSYIDAVKSGTEAYPYTEAVACRCQAGNQFRKNLPTYDPKRHCKTIRGSKSEELESIRQFIDDYRPANHERAFDQFGSVDRKTLASAGGNEEPW